MSDSNRTVGSEIRSLNGVPTLYVAGVPQGPMSFQWGLEERDIIEGSGQTADKRRRQVRRMGQMGRMWGRGRPPTLDAGG